MWHRLTSMFNGVQMPGDDLADIFSDSESENENESVNESIFSQPKVVPETPPKKKKKKKRKAVEIDLCNESDLDDEDPDTEEERRLRYEEDPEEALKDDLFEDSRENSEELSEVSEPDVLDICEMKLEKKKKKRKKRKKRRRLKRVIDSDMGGMTNSDDPDFEEGDTDVDGPPLKVVRRKPRAEELYETVKKKNLVVERDPQWWASRIVKLNEEAVNGSPPIMFQDSAVERVRDSLLIRAAGANSKNNPGIHVLAGASGHGKSALAERIGTALFSKEAMGYEAYIKIDLSGYCDRLDSSRLWGSSPGTVGSDQAGALVAFLESVPARMDFYDACVNFEEADKADSSIFTQIMEFLDRGFYTDNSKGAQHKRPNLLVLMTTNTGADTITEAVGDPRAQPALRGALENSVKAEIGETMCKSHSVAGRLGDPVLFFNFTTQQCATLVKEMVATVGAEISKFSDDRFDMDDKTAHRVTQVYYNSEHGMRSITPFLLLLRRAYAMLTFEPQRQTHKVAGVFAPLEGSTPKLDAFVNLKLELRVAKE